MTIIAGFKSPEGVVLCADTLETREHTKRKVAKLRFEPHSQLQSDSSVNRSLAVAFCEAGDGPFIDKLTEEAWKAAQSASSLNEACSSIAHSIEEQHEKFGKIYQTGFLPETQLIFGIKMDGGSRLFTALGPVVTEKHGYDSGGIGYYVADFLAGRMYKDQLNIRQCVILAAYILYQAKEHVEGCGGDSHIVVLRDNESSGYVDWQRVEAITKLLESADDDISNLLMWSANLDIDDKLFKDRVGLSMCLLETLRHNAKENLEKSAQKKAIQVKNLMAEGLLAVKPKETDSLGLPILLDDEKSEPEK